MGGRPDVKSVARPKVFYDVLYSIYPIALESRYSIHGNAATPLADLFICAA